MTRFLLFRFVYDVKDFLPKVQHTEISAFSLAALPRTECFIYNCDVGIWNERTQKQGLVFQGKPICQDIPIPANEVPKEFRTMALLLT